MAETICKSCEFVTLCRAGRDSLNGSKVKILGCSRYEKKPIKTNADRIRVMTDEELAHWIVEMKITGCPEDQFSTMWCVDMSCVDCWLDWLKKECEP